MTYILGNDVSGLEATNSGQIGSPAIPHDNTNFKGEFYLLIPKHGMTVGKGIRRSRLRFRNLRYRPQPAHVVTNGPGNPNAMAPLPNEAGNEMYPFTGADQILAPPPQPPNSPVILVAPSVLQIPAEPQPDIPAVEQNPNNNGQPDEGQAPDVATMEILEEDEGVPLDCEEQDFLRGGHYLGRRTGLLEGSPAVLWSLLQMNGSRCLSVEQYGSVRALLQGRHSSTRAVAPSGSGILPHYTTMTRTILPHILRILSVRATEIYTPVDLRKKGAAAKRTVDGVPEARISFVPPMEYARNDMRDPQLFKEFKESIQVVESWPIICGREYFYGPVSDIETEEGQPRAEVGDIISIGIYSRAAVKEPFKSSFETTTNRTVNGRITYIFQCIHSGQEEYRDSHNFGPNMDRRTRQIRGLFARVQFAWADGNPRIQPSDIVVVIAPIYSGKDDRICLVYRFLQRHNDKNRYLIGIKGGTAPEEHLPYCEKANRFITCIHELPSKMSSVRKVQLMAMHRRARGYKAKKNASAIGELDDGTPYCIYRFLLYADGFNAHNNVSYEGVYIQPLGLKRRREERKNYNHSPTRGNR